MQSALGLLIIFGKLVIMSSRVSQAPQINGGHREDSSQVRLIEDGQNNE
jgi:hypothetical protein